MMLERLRYDGVPLHSVGIQAHLDLAKAPFSQKVFAAFLKDIADMGFAIVITELDVKEHIYTLSPDDRDQRVGEIVTDYLDVALAERAVEGVITWGLSAAAPGSM
jgi:endo-1,4-beta-xylanase